MFPAWMFSHEVPYSHVEVFEDLATAAPAVSQAAWAAMPQCSDAFRTRVLTTFAVKDLPLLARTEVVSLSDEAVDALLKRKRLAVLQWASRQDVSSASAVKLASSHRKCASALMYSDRVLGESALLSEVAAFEGGSDAAWHMLVSGDFSALDSLDLSRLNDRRGVHIRSLLCAEFPERFDWLRSGGSAGGSWFALGSPYATEELVPGCVKQTPWTLMVAIWNPMFSVEQCRAFIDDLPSGFDDSVRSRGIEALAMRSRLHPHSTSDMATESDPETLDWLIRRCVKQTAFSHRLADMGLLLDNPHLSDGQRGRLIVGLAAMWGDVPPRVACSWAERTGGEWWNEPEFVDLLDQQPLDDRGFRQRPTGSPAPVPELGDGPLRWCQPAPAVAFLCRHLPADAGVWRVAQALWEQGQQLSGAEFVEMVRAAAV